MPVPIVYRKSSENSVVNYNYADIADGTGVVVFLGLSNEDVSGITYMASQEAIISSQVSTYAGTSSASPTLVATLNFDVLPFNLPKTINGVAVICGSLYIENGAQSHVNFDIQKYDGSTYTSLNNLSTKDYTYGTTGLYSFSIKLSLSSTSFKIGDAIRVVAKMYSQKVGGSGAFRLAHSPTNSTDTWFTSSSNYPTQLQFRIPFKIDL
jgi:hypothetical protein